MANRGNNDRDMNKKVSKNVLSSVRSQTHGSATQSNLLCSSSYITLISFVVLLIAATTIYVYQPSSSLSSATYELPFYQIFDTTRETIVQWTCIMLTTARELIGFHTILPESVLAGLLRHESSVAVRCNATIAIGFGACTDLVVRSMDIFHKFAAPANPQPHFHIESMQDLLELFAYYFKHGAASERYIKSKQVFDQLLQLIKKSPDIWHTNIGGNAPLMSQRFAHEGIEQILLGAQVTPEFVRQLPSNLQISGPIIERDDYHILLEYQTGQRWGPYKSPRSNRLIVHNDDNNAQLISRSHFFERALAMKPDLLIISGLQMLDNSPISIDVRRKAISSIADDLHRMRQQQPQNLKIHYELASFTENALLSAVIDDIFPHVDSFGMNEQEVANLLSFLKFGNISFVSSPFPRIAHVIDEMREAFSLLASIGDGRVSRVHVHTLAYQVVAVRIDNQPHRNNWSHSASAMAKASLTAYRHTCGSEDIDLKRAHILLDDSFTTSMKSKRFMQRIYFDAHDSTACWTEQLPHINSERKTSIRLQFCLAIGMVCTEVIQTGGAGDNVSAGGLVLQI